VRQTEFASTIQVLAARKMKHLLRYRPFGIPPHRSTDRCPIKGFAVGRGRSAFARISGADAPAVTRIRRIQERFDGLCRCSPSQGAPGDRFCRCRRTGQHAICLAGPLNGTQGALKGTSSGANSGSYLLPGEPFRSSIAAANPCQPRTETRLRCWV